MTSSPVLQVKQYILKLISNFLTLNKCAFSGPPNIDVILPSRVRCGRKYKESPGRHHNEHGGHVVQVDVATPLVLETEAEAHHGVGRGGVRYSGPAVGKTFMWII